MSLNVHHNLTLHHTGTSGHMLWPELREVTLQARSQQTGLARVQVTRLLVQVAHCQAALNARHSCNRKTLTAQPSARRPTAMPCVLFAAYGECA